MDRIEDIGPDLRECKSKKTAMDSRQLTKPETCEQMEDDGADRTEVRYYIHWQVTRVLPQFRRSMMLLDGNIVRHTYIVDANYLFYLRDRPTTRSAVEITKLMLQLRWWRAVAIDGTSWTAACARIV